MSEPWSALTQLLEDGWRHGVYTAAAALVGFKAELQWQAATGWLSRDPAAPAATNNTVFDLASLTKPLATALALMALTDQRKVAPAAALGEVLPAGWLPEDKRPLTLASLLAHRAGLPAWQPFYREMLAAPAETRGALLPHLAAAAPLAHDPDTATLYSDLGFMLLQAVAEAASGLPLDSFCEEKVYRPLGLKTLGFRPISRGGGRLQYAATETGLIPGRNIYGEVHDENAWAAGGVAGHAGLFGAGVDAFALVAALYRAYQGDTGQPFSSDTVRRFLTPVAPGTQTLGFDTPGPEASQCSAGRYFSPNSVGHLGFTGTSFWLDLESGQMVVLLTNRVHLGRDDKTKIQAFRPRFHEAASKALGFAEVYRE